MLWVKAFHVIFMVTWFAGLFYLPRLFVYHAMSDDAISSERFKVMERKLLIMMHIGGTLTVLFGLILLAGYAWEAYKGEIWLHMKLTLVLALIGYHAWCWKLVKDFKHDRNTRGNVFYRWFNEAPVLALVGVVLLVYIRP
ncbi:MAG TPA: CopD family protein [Gammaproteobacteria bacterium]|nr:CopD family protein [Gammaproteobacteria bacterium]